MRTGIYQHHKGGRYRVYFVAKHSENLEELVCYEQLESNTFWVRPKAMFLETIEKDGTTVPRFKFVESFPTS